VAMVVALLLSLAGGTGGDTGGTGGDNGGGTTGGTGATGGGTGGGTSSSRPRAPGLVWAAARRRANTHRSCSHCTALHCHGVSQLSPSIILPECRPPARAGEGGQGPGRARAKTTVPSKRMYVFIPSPVREGTTFMEFQGLRMEVCLTTLGYSN
jgi:hypothetical protein